MLIPFIVKPHLISRRDSNADTQIDVAKLFLFFIVVVVVLSQMSTTRAENMKDASIYGVWRPIIYEFGGIEHPIEEGLMVITPNYLIATAIYDLDGDGQSDANANHGPIEFVEPGKLMMDQKMQLHWRTSDNEGHFFKKDIPEEINYTVEGDRLIFHFPDDRGASQRWISERVIEEK